MSRAWDEIYSAYPRNQRAFSFEICGLRTKVSSMRVVGYMHCECIACSMMPTYFPPLVDARARHRRDLHRFHVVLRTRKNFPMRTFHQWKRDYDRPTS